MALPECGGAVDHSNPAGDAGHGSTGPFTEPASDTGPVGDDSGVSVPDPLLIDPSTRPAPIDAAPLPGASCNFALPSGGGACSWVRSFTGDPIACAGFVGVGNRQQCFTICDMSSASQTADACEVHGLSEGGVSGYVSCTSTTGACGDSGSGYVPPPGNGGRRPGYFASLGFGAAPPGRELGTHFARVACMEAGSVVAFQYLRDELLAHGAPKRLVRAASRAIRDEMRHVRQTSALARRFGEEPIAPLPELPHRIRTLLAMALENAVEGCIRETYSALECAWQGQVATDAVVRATMQRIARDELRHLALAWAVHGWAIGRLDPAARARVREAQRDEVAVLKSELGRDPHESLLSKGGLPRAFQSQALVDAIEAKLAA
jgi:hypothetical protein